MSIPPPSPTYAAEKGPRCDLLAGLPKSGATRVGTHDDTR